MLVGLYILWFEKVKKLVLMFFMLIGWVGIDCVLLMKMYELIL